MVRVRLSARGVMGKAIFQRFYAKLKPVAPVGVQERLDVPIVMAWDMFVGSGM